MMSLAVFTEMLGGLEGEAGGHARSGAAGLRHGNDLADYLVKKGVPFREAHEIVAQTVRYAESRERALADLKLPELQQFSSLIGDDVFDAITLEGSLAARSHIGGTAPARVKAAIVKARKGLS